MPNGPSAVVDIPIAVLAGGLATRLYPLTSRTPKSLIPVAGKPFLEHQLELLRASGLEHVVLCVGYLGEMIQREIGNGSRFGLTVEYSSDGVTPLGTGGAVRNALPLLDGAFFVLYGDSYLPIDYAAVADFFHRSGKLGCMTVFRNEGRYDKSNVVFRDGEIKLYDKSVQLPEMQHIDYGLNVFRTEAFEKFPPNTPFDIADLMRELVATHQLAGYEVTQRFYEVGSRQGLAELEGHLARIEAARGAGTTKPTD